MKHGMMSHVEQRTMLSVTDLRVLEAADRKEKQSAERYCILRLHGQHYRTEVFSLTLDCRRTAVDDRKAKRRRTTDDSDHGVWLTAHPAERAQRQGAAREDVSEEIIIELYDGRANTESDSIDRFTPATLGSFRLKTDDILGQLDSGDSLEPMSRAVDLIDSEGLQDRPCDEVADYCRREGWFGGIARRDGSREPGLKVAVRLEIWRFDGCGVERSEPVPINVPVHDSFGHAVAERNISKCLSSYGLWRLQERWKLETAQQIWSRFQADRSSVDPELGALVWSGIPSNMREEVYMELSGAGAKRGQFESDKAVGYCYYTQLLRKCRNLEDRSRHTDGDLAADAAGTGCLTSNKAVEETKVESVWWEIENDIGRVFINGKSLVNTAQGMASLRRLLRAYSIHNQAIGYCQGLNFVAGLLLEVVSEESAFWLLSHVCEELHQDYFTPSMAGAKSDIAALKDLVRRELPRFHTQTTEMGLPLELVATKWLIAGFVNSFPPCTALRILEVAFLEGSDVYLATALAFLRMHETGPAHFCIGSLVAHLDLCQSGMYEVDILLHQTRRELASIGDNIRAARLHHRNRQDGSEADQDERPERDGWLQGRSSTQSGSSAWLLHVPKSLVSKAEAVLSTLNKRTLTITRGGSLMVVAGCRWVLGLKKL